MLVVCARACVDTNTDITFALFHYDMIVESPSIMPIFLKYMGDLRGIDASKHVDLQEQWSERINAILFERVSL